MYQTNPSRPPQETMPTMYDLPSELVGESGLPDEFHCIQADLLSETCQPPNYSPEEILLASDLNLYYDPRRTLWYKRPDWYMVLGVPNANQQQDLRLSYVIWQEGVAPFLVVELLSPGTEQEDLGTTLREVIDTLRSKDTEILGSTSPLRLDPLRYLTQRWFSPQALTFGMPYRSWIAPRICLLGAYCYIPVKFCVV